MAGKREEQMKEITERLEQGVKELFTSEMYTEYLRTMSQFHNYSFNNTLLIAMQKPDATLVAGFQAWQKKFERHVKRGEKGIQIIAPVPIREKQEMEKIDPITQEPVLRPDGQPETEEVEVVIPRFRVTTVFDVSQTEGKPLPELDTPELMGSVENFDNFMKAIEAISPVPIRFAEIDSDAKGYYHNVDKEIVIQEGMSESQAMKTAVHEVTHAMLHDRELMEELGERKNQMTREVEAESVAYSVCQYFGLDTSNYSFPYIAGWSSNMDMKELRTSMDTIRKMAGEFIDSMTETMRSLMREQPEKEHLEENDLIMKISGSMGSEYSYHIVGNMDKEELLVQLQSYHELYSESGEMGVEEFLEQQGAKLIPWYDSSGFIVENPVSFYDVEYDYDTGITNAVELPAMEQVAMLIDRAEYRKTYFDDQERNLIMNYAFKLDDMEDTKTLMREMIGAMAEPGIRDVYEVMETAQAEIDALPDGMMALSEMHQYGYLYDGMLPLSQERVLQLYHEGLEVFCLYPDGTEAAFDNETSALEHDGLFGVEKEAWENYRNQEQVQEVAYSPDRTNEESLPDGTGNRYGIYQIDRDGKGREYSFMNMDFVKEHGLTVNRSDYKLVYSDDLTEADTLDSLYEKFNINHPADFTGHSLSVSDVVVFQRGDEIKSYYVDSLGFTELPEFILQYEIEQKRAVEAVSESAVFQVVTEQTSGLEVEGHLGTWHTIDMREIQGETFYLMEHDAREESVTDIIVNGDGKLVAEDLEHGFDEGAMAAIAEYFSEKGIVVDNPASREEQEKAAPEDAGQPVPVEPELRKALEGSEIPVYKHPGVYASEHMEAHWYRMSMRANIACKKAIEAAITENFDGMHLKHDVAKPVALAYGAERVEYVLANTVQQKNWDGRFSSKNQEWAQTVPVVEDKDYFGSDRRREFVVESHPAVLDGFIGLARKEFLELTAQKKAEQTKEKASPFIAGYYVVEDLQKQGAFDIHSYEDMEEAVQAYFALPNDKTKAFGIENSKPLKGSLDFIQCKNGIDTAIEDFRKVEGWENSEILEAVKKVKSALESHDTEIAYQVAEKYFKIQTVSDGYDYTFYDQNFRELDGGVYGNPDISIKEAIEEILSDKGISLADCKVVSHEKLQEQVSEAEKEDMQGMPLISDMTEPEVALNNLSRAEIEETVLCYAQSQIDEMGLTEDVKLLGARVYGSRCREGLYTENSDIDVVVSYSGDIREDDFFSMLHGDGLQLAGLPVDINPISTEKTGMLEEYIENAEKYLDMKQVQELTSEKIVGETYSNPLEKEASIRFYVAECMEFPVLGEFHENLTLQEAMELYQRIPADRMNGIKGIGFCLEDGSMYDGNFDLMSGGEVLKDIINEIPHYRESPLVQKAITDMETILSKQAEKPMQQSPMQQSEKPQEPQAQDDKEIDMSSVEKASKPEKMAEKAPRTGRDMSEGTNKKQSVLTALRERQAKLKAQEQRNSQQKSPALGKGEQEL